MIPIIDICRLEDTKFVTGIDMESVWKQMFVDFECARRQCITSDDAVNEVTVGDVIPSSIQSSWKHHFFSIFLDLIIRGKRPYGHFNTYDEDYNILSGIKKFHPVDYINYLVAMKCENSSAREKLVTAGANHLLPILSYQEECESWHSNKNKFQARHFKAPRRRPGTDPLPCLQYCLPHPGKAYHEACRAEQFVPPRYTKFFSEGSLLARLYCTGTDC